MVAVRARALATVVMAREQRAFALSDFVLPIASGVHGKLGPFRFPVGLQQPVRRLELCFHFVDSKERQTVRRLQKHYLLVVFGLHAVDRSTQDLVELLRPMGLSIRRPVAYDVRAPREVGHDIMNRPNDRRVPERRGFGVTLLDFMLPPFVHSFVTCVQLVFHSIEQGHGGELLSDQLTKEIEGLRPDALRVGAARTELPLRLTLSEEAPKLREEPAALLIGVVLWLMTLV